MIKKCSDIKVKKYNIEDFLISRDDLDLDSWRLYSPLDILFMINTKCVTDCIYCYADRRKKIGCEISIERLGALVKNARDLDMRSFDLTGGELFLYPHWEEFLSELVANGFNPYISTKMSLNTETIEKMRDIGIKRIQISLDSVFRQELIEVLNVKEDYHNKVLDTIQTLDKYGFEIYTNSQLTRFNSNIDNIRKMIEYLSRLENIKRINIGVAGFSLYKGQSEYLAYRPDLRKVKRIENFIKEIKEKSGRKINVNFPGYFVQESYFNKDIEKRRQKFNERSRCSANFYAMILLPDGKVTICEELYWHPGFIIGDLTKQSIEEVWCSDRALELSRLSKAKIRPKSACKSCNEFEECHQTRGICWKEILYAYGYDNWDYPDPKCPQAPIPQRVFYLE